MEDSVKDWIVPPTSNIHMLKSYATVSQNVAIFFRKSLLKKGIYFYFWLH